MIRCSYCRSIVRTIAIGLLLRAATSAELVAQEMPPGAGPGNFAAAPWDAGVVGYPPTTLPAAPPEQVWITPSYGQQTPMAASSEYGDPGWGNSPVVLDCPSDAWCWQVLPDGLIYHSYWAGVHEPRLGGVLQHISSGDSFIDGTVGGRAGILRYGATNAIFPQGWQLDIEAAAMLRLTLDHMRDFESADYRVGIPLTYGVDNWQFKIEVYHLSSHLGDEYAIENPGSLDDRINYVRDAVVIGASYYPVPVCRLYSEVGYAFNADGGAEPWEIQFGTELSQPGPTGPRGTPFLAINGHLREEVDFGGDVSAQIGWLWRGNSGQVLRTGFHYFNGQSSQYQFFDNHEQQFGAGMWFDF